MKPMALKALYFLYKELKYTSACFQHAGWVKLTCVQNTCTPPPNPAPATRHANALLSRLDKCSGNGCHEVRELCDLAIVNHTLVLIGAGSECHAAVLGKGPPNELDIHCT